MKKQMPIYFLLFVLMFTGCKSVKVFRLYTSNVKTKNKIVPLTPAISTAKMPRNYNYGRRKKSSTSSSDKKVAKPFDYSSGFNSDYADLSTRYFYYVFDDLNKRNGEDHLKEELVKNLNGEILLTVNSYKRPPNIIASLLLTPSWLTIGPMLVGVPVGVRKAKLNLQIDIKNNKGDIIKTYTTKSRHTAAVGCYWGYNKAGASEVAHLKALNKGLKRIAKQIDADAGYINGRLFMPGDYALVNSDPNYLLSMGKAMMENGNNKEALYVLNKAYLVNALTVDEKKVPVSFYIAVCLNNLKSYPESAEWMQKAEKQNKEVVVAQEKYKSVTESNGSKSGQASLNLISKESVDAFEKDQIKAKEAYEMKIKAFDFMKQAEEFYKDKKYAQAIEKFEAAFKYINTDSKDFATSFYHFGDSYFQLSNGVEDYGKVVDLLKKSYALDSEKEVMVPASLFLCFKSLKKYDDALVWYKNTINHKGTTEKLNKLMLEWKTKMLAEKEQLEPGKKLIEQPVDVKVSNVGSNINGKYDDYFPSMTADESTFIFTSRREGSTGTKNSEGKYDEDLWFCERINDTTWSTPKNMGKPVNTEKNNGTASFTGDGQFVVSGRCGESDGFGSCDNYYSILTGKTWSTPKNMGKTINSEEWDGQACISADGKTLVFSSQRSGGFGDADLWMSKLKDDGSWTTPKNLGSKVNTSGYEYSPYLHPDGKTLFFSSDNLSPRIGGHDIYKSVLQDDGTWSKPENVGYPINSENDDLYFVLAPSGLTGYFASDRKGGFGGNDIYRVDYPKAKQTSLVTVVGFVYDEETRQPISADVQIQDVEKNEVVGAYKSNEATGKFVVVLTPGRNYSLTVNKKEYLFYSENFNVADTNGFVEVKKEVYLQKIKTGKKIVLNNIFFEFGKSSLKPESEIEINRLLQLMNENPDIKVEISGHTDNVGDDKSNMQLSQARAEVVVNALVAKGIAKTRLISKGYGKSTPVAKNDTEEGRQLNRRTEFKIISK